jgi:hypothetical protein
MVTKQIGTFMKQITYAVKSTKANTEYRQVNIQDKHWILQQVKQSLAIINGCQQSFNQELKHTAVKYILPNGSLIRKGDGHMNSIKSLLEGIHDNMVNGTQRDFSDKTCKGLKSAFDALSNDFNDIQAIEWIDKETVSGDFFPKTTLSTLWGTI